MHPCVIKIANKYARIQTKNELLDKIVYNIEMLNTNREFYVIFQNRAGDEIKPQMRKSPTQIGRVGMSARPCFCLKPIASISP